MIRYRLHAVLKGEMDFDQLFSSAQKTQRVLEPNGLSKLTASWQVNFARHSFFGLGLMVPSVREANAVAPYALAHLMIAAGEFEPDPNDPAIQDLNRLRKRKSLTNLWGQERELYRGPWHEHDQRLEQAKAQKERVINREFAFVYASGQTKGGYEEFRLPAYFDGQLERITDERHIEKVATFLLYHSHILNNLNA